MNKRGVGILLKNSIPFLVLREERDGEDNILGLRLSLEGSEFCILSVYGPNNVHPAFFTDLNAVIRRLGPSPFIIGGDWNCTVSTLNGELNHDTLHMRQSPNIRHSVLLNNLCRELEASDPFRVKFPNKIDFTYFPSDPLKKNRSRIDFFITSNCLTSQIKKCLISPNLQNKSFDHRGITICFKDPPRIIKQPTLSRALLRDPDLELVVKLAIADTYIIHSTELPQDESDNFKLEVGRAKASLREAGLDCTYLPPNSRSDLEILNRSGILASIKELLDRFPFDQLAIGDFPEDLKADIFMETLVNNIRNEAVCYQIFIAKEKMKIKSSLIDRLNLLKSNYSVNSDDIMIIERKLDQLADTELRSKIESTSLFEILNNEKITPHFVDLARGNKSDATLDSVKNSDGLPFNSSDERKTYIRNYYAEL